MITEVLDKISSEIDLEISPERSEIKKDCVIYSLFKEYDSGSVTQYQLTIKIVTKHIKTGDLTKQIIDNILITKGDEKKFDSINSCIQNGGGQFYDPELNMYQTISYYDIITKSKIDWR